MRRPLNPRICPVAIDANAIDRYGDERDALVERILSLHEAGVINLIVPKGVRTELQHPHTPQNVQAAALQKLFTLPVELNPEERAQHRKIEVALRGNAAPGKHAADADHLFEAGKYGGYFITHDQRILDKSSQIRALLPPSLTVVTLAGFLEIYDQTESVL